MSLELVVERGPLPEDRRRQVMAGWGRYDPRLLDPEEWAAEFERGPHGPAVHAVVLADDGRVLGHHAAIPLGFRLRGQRLILGKGEALYVDRGPEREARVEIEGRPVGVAQALTGGLYARYRDLGLESYFGYATPQAERRHVQAGCAVVELPYRRFFHLHDVAGTVAASARFDSPLKARAARAALAAATAAARLRGRRRPPRSLPVTEVPEFDRALDERLRASLDPERLALDPAADQLNWRFAGRGYRIFVLGDPPWGYAVLAPEDAWRRRRVVDWLVPVGRLGDASALAGVLASASSDSQALEWAVPGGSPPGSQLASALRRSTLLRDPRTRSYRMVVHGDERFTASERWSLTLATQERF